MTDLVDFLRQRLDEAEAAAWSIHDVSKCDALLYEEDMAAAARRDPDCDCGRPGRERREVAAKRAILDAAEADMDSPYDLPEGVRDSRDEWERERDGALAGAALETLRHLAAVYADHPDYDEAWRP